MNTRTVIMVQIAKRKWTLDALRCACLRACKMPVRIALVKLIPVQHFAWLGTDLGYMNFSEQDRIEFIDYQKIVRENGVQFSAHLFQYASLHDAILQAANFTGAQIVYATLPKSIIPFKHNYQLQWLRHHLAQQRRELIEQLPCDLHPFSFHRTYASN